MFKIGNLGKILVNSCIQCINLYTDLAVYDIMPLGNKSQQ